MVGIFLSILFHSNIFSFLCHAKRINIGLLQKSPTRKNTKETNLITLDMSKFTKAIAAIMLTVAVICTACTKDPENGGNNNGGNGDGNGSGLNPTTEGIYLGIIGFNYNLKSKDISLLNTSTKSSFTSFIDNLTMENLTGLYYADYTALKKLNSFGQPPKLTNIALVTFTDGLDNASLDDSERNPENYPTREAYLNALNNKIRTDKVHGLDINAYTIGLRGNDVQDVTAFQNNLKKLASNDNNVFEVTNMDEAIQRFAEIAESLHSTNTTTSLSLLVPPGYDDGLVLRFTFDQVSSASNSSLFIECTYKRTDNGRRLESISYQGFKQGATFLSSVEKLPNGFYKFVFENLKKDDESFVTEIDKNRLKLYRQVSMGWEPETEFDNNNQSSVIEEQSSALIMLVLDCTTSLGSQFSALKIGAKRFVEILVSSTGGGGGNNGGGNGTHNGYSYVDLGLPSGTLWATCNVGAYSPEEYGDYFAWGETQPKATYSWNNYMFCNGNSYQITKYCNVAEYGYNGFTDDLVYLQQGDDAATYNWGNGWSTPTRHQWDELLENTSHIWTTQNGVNGRLFTSNNGKSIFLPAAGSVWSNGNVGDTYNCNYWTNSSRTDLPYYSWNFYSRSDYFTESFFERSIGYSVRPVHSAK